MLRRWVDDTFDPTTPDSVKVLGFLLKRVQLAGEVLNVQAFTTNRSNERFQEIERQHMRGADGYILFYDMTRRASFEYVTARWAALLQEGSWIETRHASVLVGCKSDLCEPESDACEGVGAHRCRREVARAEAEAFSAEYSMPFFEASAKDGSCVHEAYSSLLQQLQQLLQQQEQQQQVTDEDENDGTSNPAACRIH